MRELARRSGLSAAQISRIESGEVERPSAETLARLAIALERSPEALYVAVGHLDVAEAVPAVRRLLLALPPGTAGDLAGALHAMDDVAESISRLEIEASMLEGELRSRMEQLEVGHSELMRASRDAEKLEELSAVAGAGEYAERAQEANQRAIDAQRAMEQHRGERRPLRNRA